jgi:hypothetical protein
MGQKPTAACCSSGSATIRIATIGPPGSYRSIGALLAAFREPQESQRAA